MGKLIAKPDYDPEHPYHYHMDEHKIVISPEEWTANVGKPWFKEIEDAVKVELEKGPEYIESENPEFTKAYMLLRRRAYGPQSSLATNYWDGKNWTATPLPQGYSRDLYGVITDSKGNYYTPLYPNQHNILNLYKEGEYFVNKERNGLGYDTDVYYVRVNVPEKTIKTIKSAEPYYYSNTAPHFFGFTADDGTTIGMNEELFNKYKNNPQFKQKLSSFQLRHRAPQLIIDENIINNSLIDKNTELINTSTNLQTTNNTLYNPPAVTSIQMKNTSNEEKKENIFEATGAYLQDSFEGLVSGIKKLKKYPVQYTLYDVPESDKFSDLRHSLLVLLNDAWDAGAPENVISNIYKDLDLTNSYVGKDYVDYIRSLSDMKDYRYYMLNLLYEGKPFVRGKESYDKFNHYKKGYENSYLTYLRLKDLVEKGYLDLLNTITKRYTFYKSEVEKARNNPKTTSHTTKNVTTKSEKYFPGKFNFGNGVMYKQGGKLKLISKE